MIFEFVMAALRSVKVRMEARAAFLFAKLVFLKVTSSLEVMASFVACGPSSTGVIPTLRTFAT
jgi:hypothetical protein